MLHQFKHVSFVINTLLFATCWGVAALLFRIFEANAWLEHLLLVVHRVYPITQLVALGIWSFFALLACCWWLTARLLKDQIFNNFAPLLFDKLGKVWNCHTEGVARIEKSLLDELIVGVLFLWCTKVGKELIERLNVLRVNLKSSKDWLRANFESLKVIAALKHHR